LKRLVGAPVVVTQLLGTPLVEGEQLPVLLGPELLMCAADMIETLVYLWVSKQFYSCALQPKFLLRFSALIPGAWTLQQ
jgi:hypothetical protein